jgi:E3 ubiquitin-protein ligase SHPRH
MILNPFNVEFAVLDVMIKEAETNYSSTRLRHAGMHEVLEEWDVALKIYLEGIKYSEKRVEEARNEVEEAKKNSLEPIEAVGTSKAAMDRLKNAELEKKQNALSVARNRLSNSLLLLHRFFFYAAGMYHELKDEENETKLYDTAEEIRRELLQHSQNKVMYNTWKQWDIIHGDINPNHLLVQIYCRRSGVKF